MLGPFFRSVFGWQFIAFTKRKRCRSSEGFSKNPTGWFSWFHRFSLHCWWRLVLPQEDVPNPFWWGIVPCARTAQHTALCKDGLMDLASGTFTTDGVGQLFKFWRQEDCMGFSANFHEEVVRTAFFSQWQDHCEALLNEMPIRFPKDQPSLGESSGQASMGQNNHSW